jgi:hypothetical protein
MKNKEKNPFDWDNITIEKYYEIMDVLNDEADDDITKNVKLVSIMLDKDEQEIWDMDMTEAGGYISKLKFLNKFDIPDHPNMKFNLPGYNLEVIKDVTKINVAQYVDFQNFVKMPLRDGMDKILSVFLIPVGCKYNDGYDIIDLQRVIRENLSFRVAEGLLGFFLRKYTRLLMDSLSYCRRQIRKTKDPEMMEKLKATEMEAKKKLQDLIALTGCS